MTSHDLAKKRVHIYRCKDMGTDVRKRVDTKTSRRATVGSTTPPPLRLAVYLALSFISGYSLSTFHQQHGFNTSTTTTTPTLTTPVRRSLTDCSISISNTKYKGTQYTTKATIGSPKCLVESKFLKVQQHVVQLEGTTNVIDDWLWIDYHDRINVLIEAPRDTDTTTTTNTGEPHFIILQQTKYALEGRTSLAIVGGIIEPGESPDDAARREVLEETGQTCRQLELLGRYRTDVNRGMGWTNTYVATKCTTAAAAQNRHSAAAADEVGPADTEHQSFLTMSLTQVREAVMAGKFLEIQWSATVALAMLRYETTSNEAQ